MYEIIPSPGTQDHEWAAIENKIAAVKSFARTIHIDICDGKFAPNTTFLDPKPFAKYTNELFFEVHLMVEEPINFIKSWSEAGFKRFIGQIEKMSDQAAFVAQAQLFGEAGLAIDGPTPLDQLKVPYADLDVLLFYTGDRAGFSGKPFQEDRLEKVKAVRAKEEYLPIEVDGGITDETIATAFTAGVTRFVTTSFLFALNTPQQQYELLQKQVERLTNPTV